MSFSISPLHLRIAACAVLWLSSATIAGVAHAQAFAALVSPPRFELSAKPGQKLRDVIEITNADPRATRIRVKTADWILDKNGGAVFDEALKPGSCRPWVAIERRELTLTGGGKYRFRFEVSPPTDAPVGECRFAILLEGDELNVQSPNGPSFPVAGRIGVIVYVTVGDAAPALEIASTEVANVNGETLPVLKVRNTGNAHGRLAGFLSGTDASGRKLDFVPSTLPILPGETRTIPLTVNREKDEPFKIAFPVTVRGNLEWADKSVKFEQRFAP